MVICRLSAADQFCAGVLGKSGANFVIYIMTRSGGYSVRATAVTSTAWDVTTQHGVTLTASGNNLTFVFDDDSTTANYSTSFNNTATSCGIRMDGNADLLDEFKVVSV